MKKNNTNKSHEIPMVPKTSMRLNTNAMYFVLNESNDYL
jgi:hypothetical protein